MSDDRAPAPTPRLRRMLDAAITIARELGHSQVGVEHVFLAMTADRTAIPAQLLARSAGLDEAEAGVRAVMSAPGYAGQPPPGAIWFPLAELPSLLDALPRCLTPGVQWGFNIASDQAWIIAGEPDGTTARPAGMS
jgi:Clp amino terminal domain, pathogenicity island component